MQHRVDEATPLESLLTQLEAAVADGNRDRAEEIERLILVRLAASETQLIEVEQRIRKTMAALRAPAKRGLLDLELSGVRGGGNRDDVVYPVWYGTNRKPADDGSTFTSERSQRVTRGRVEVFIPESHRFGETGSSFWQRLKRFQLRDDRLKVQSVTPLEQQSFIAEINAAMQDARDANDVPHGLVFLHGYNNSFEDAAIRAAQIGFDLKVTGATAFFSWPSKNSLRAYAADESTIEASEAAITQFLVDFSNDCNAEQIHVIAHSMGNRGLLRSLQRIAGNAETRGKVRFGQVFLAAPDVDRDLFTDLAHLYPEHAERTTLYASNGDLAVHMSAKLHAAPRAGYFEPYTVVGGIDTIAVPDFDVDMLGHSYFAQAEALLSDMADLISLNRDPEKRRRIRPLEQDGLLLHRLRR